MDQYLAEELTEDSRLAWELFNSSSEAGEAEMADEYRWLAEDAEKRLARHAAGLQGEGQRVA